MADLIRFRRIASLHTLEVCGLAGSAARDAASTYVTKLAKLIEKSGCCGF
jgi:hypothetical protein